MSPILGPRPQFQNIGFEVVSDGPPESFYGHRLTERAVIGVVVKTRVHEKILDRKVPHLRQKGGELGSVLKY